MYFRLILVSVLFFTTVSFSQILQDGTYIGYEPLKSYNEKTHKYEFYGNYPKERWYHENILTIRSDSLKLDSSPMYISGKDTTYSVSDGLFFYYKGIILKDKKNLFAVLKLERCDYCIFRLIKKGNTTIVDSTIYKKVYRYKIKLKGDSLVIDNVLYKRK